ncbi:MAG: acetyl-CoA carboxylase carboxyl transferase subunit beta, partial [Halobacillus sp.]
MLRDFFSKKKRYASIPRQEAKKDVPEGLMQKCPNCQKIFYRKELNRNMNVCPHCDHHHRLNAYERLEHIFDGDTFEEWDKQMISSNPLGFPDYEEKLEKDRLKSDLNEAVVTGRAQLNGLDTAV